MHKSFWPYQHAWALFGPLQPHRHCRHHCHCHRCHHHCLHHLYWHWFVHGLMYWGSVCDSGMLNKGLSVLNCTNHINLWSVPAMSERHVPLSILWAEKLTCTAASLSRRWFVSSICPRALNLLDRCQGYFTALICFDSIMEEQRPFGDPNIQIMW